MDEPVKSAVPKPKISLMLYWLDKIVEKSKVGLPVDLFCVVVGLLGNPTCENFELISVIKTF